MTSTRRKSSSGFSLLTDETVETVEETPTEVPEVTEVAEVVKEEVVVEKKEPSPVLNNPAPVAERKTSRRNTPKFSTQR
jgi:hypothetical protein